MAKVSVKKIKDGRGCLSDKDETILKAHCLARLCSPLADERSVIRRMKCIAYGEGAALFRPTKLLEMLAKEVRVHYASTDPRFSDAIAWMLKGLGKSKKRQYIPLLEEVRANARDRKIRKYAQVSLD